MIEPISADEMRAGFSVMTFPGSPMEVIDRVARKHGVSKSEILGRERTARISAVRHEAYAAVRDSTGMSYPAIGRIFRRDHTTILHGIRKHKTEG